jgi:hypothetical protein
MSTYLLECDIHIQVCQTESFQVQSDLKIIHSQPMKWCILVLLLFWLTTDGRLNWKFNLRLPHTKIKMISSFA